MECEQPAAKTRHKRKGEKDMNMSNRWGKWLRGIVALLFLVSLAGCQPDPGKNPVRTPNPNQQANTTQTRQVQVMEGESYSTKEEVAAYINKFHRLPSNYITKSEAMKQGWDNSKGNLWKVTNKKSIGGDRFSNLEGLLPKASGRQYYECDIDYAGGYRGAKRIIYSNDGLIFYTEDHYKSFKPLYQEGKK